MKIPTTRVTTVAPLAAVAFAAGLCASGLTAQTEAEPSVTLPDLVVTGAEDPSLGDVEGAQIFDSKKTTVVQLEHQPAPVRDDYRRAFATMPGLLVSEMAIPSHVNLNYRGIGNPHESEYLMTLRDGIPIGSDLFGYPTTYYAPPLQTIDSIQFIRGGSSLLYGPQPGPKLNFVSRRPPVEGGPRFSTEHVFGSDSLYSTFNEVSGSVGRFGYLGSFHHREADGFRDNADYTLDNGEIGLALRATEDSRLYFGFYGFESESGEAGRLTLPQYLADREQTTTPINRIWIDRYSPTLTLEQEISDDTLLIVKGWAAYQDRFSRRQNGGGTQTALDRQEFYSLGTDARVRHFWTGSDEEHALTAGVTLYSARSPRSRERNEGVSEARDGELVFDLDRRTHYGAAFAENRFQFGRFAVIPSARVDFVNLRVEENFNDEKDLQDESFSRAVPLFGLGLSYEAGANHEIYANASQGYRPPKYDDLVNPTRGAAGQGGAPDESDVLNLELGLRGAPTSWFFYDTSLFFVDWDGFVETQVIGADEIRSNSGRARYYGWETSAEVNLTRLYDDRAGSAYADRWGSFSLFGNVSFLNAEFVSGRHDGNTPAYAPDHMIKTGAVYRWQDRAKVSLTGVLLDDHFWQDSNTAGNVGTEKVAAYAVWDLALEANVYRDNVSLLAGINNLFDEDYYSRVRGDGIEVTQERNYYVGARLSF